MIGRYRTSRKTHTYPYYACVHSNNKYDACPDQPLVRTYKIDRYVWEDCCRVFERLGDIQDTIERNIQASLNSLLEDSQGKQQIMQLQAEIAYAKAEQDKHREGSYYYNLTAADVRQKEDKLRKYKTEYAESRDIATLADHYQKSVLGFLNFLNTMRGRYPEATFKEKRNALEVLGVQVSIYPKTDAEPDQPRVDITYTPIFTDVQSSSG